MRQLTSNPAAFFAVIVIGRIVAAILVIWLLNFLAYRKFDRKNKEADRDIRTGESWSGENYKKSYFGNHK